MAHPRGRPNRNAGPSPDPIVDGPMTERRREYGRRVYDWWSRHGRLLDLFYAGVFLGRGDQLRRATVDALALEPGERLLELGCGPGEGLERLRERVGPDGAVVGVDYSPGMVRRARDRVRTAGWSNVGVVRGDATRPIATDAFDAVYAAMSITATGDADAVARTAREALRPGGRIAVLDARPLQRFPLSALNPPIAAVLRRLTNWYPDADVPGALAAAFGDVDVRAYNAGSLFVATARREAEPTSTSPPGAGSLPE